MVPSGRLRTSDALRASAVQVEVEGGSAELSIHTDNPAEAAEVDLVLTPLSQ